MAWGPKTKSAILVFGNKLAQLGQTMFVLMILIKTLYGRKCGNFRQANEVIHHVPDIVGAKEWMLPIKARRVTIEKCFVKRFCCRTDKQRVR